VVIWDNVNLKKQKNVTLIIKVLEKEKQIRRVDLYKKVMKEQEKMFGKKTTYQVISRDVGRLIDNGFIKIVDGGLRSQIVELTEKAFKI
jgi:hypothetical protein